MHESAPASEYFPAPQSTQTEEPGPPYVPGKQDPAQLPAPSELNFPGSQSVHVLAPSVSLTKWLYFPAAQIAQLDAPVPLYLPATQTEQTPASSSLYFPEVHIEQLELCWCE